MQTQSAQATLACNLVNISDQATGQRVHGLISVSLSLDSPNCSVRYAVCTPPHPVGREVKPDDLPFHVVPRLLFVVLVHKVSAAYQFCERLWFPWKPSRIGVVSHYRATVCRDQGTGLGIDKDEGRDPRYFKLLGEFSLQMYNSRSV